MREVGRVQTRRSADSLWTLHWLDLALLFRVFGSLRGQLLMLIRRYQGGLRLMCELDVGGQYRISEELYVVELPTPSPDGRGDPEITF